MEFRHYRRFRAVDRENDCAIIIKLGKVARSGRCDSALLTISYVKESHLGTIWEYEHSRILCSLDLSYSYVAFYGRSNLGIHVLKPVEFFVNSSRLQ